MQHSQFDLDPQSLVAPSDSNDEPQWMIHINQLLTNTHITNTNRAEQHRTQQLDHPNRTPKRTRSTRNSMTAAASDAFIDVEPNHNLSQERPTVRRRLSFRNKSIPDSPKDQSINASTRRPNPSLNNQDVIDVDTLSDHDAQEQPTPQDVEHEQELRMQKALEHVDQQLVDELKQFLLTLVNKTEKYTPNATDTHTAYVQALSNLTYAEEFSTRLIHASKTGILMGIDFNLLKSITVILQARMSHTHKLMESAVSQNQSTNFSQSECLLALYAAQACLAILTAENAHRLLIVEELLDDIAAILKATCTMIVFCAYDPAYSMQQVKSTTNKRSNRKRRNNELNDDHDHDDDPDSNARSRSSRRTKRPMTKMQRDIMDACCAIMQSLGILFSGELRLPDPFTGQISNLVIQSLSVAGITKLQFKAVDVAGAIFAGYPALRLSMLADLREKASNMPSSKRDLRGFQLIGERATVRMTTSLFAQLLGHACSYQEDKDGQGSKAPVSGAILNAEWTKSRKEAYDLAAKLAAHFLEPMLSRAATDRNPDFRAAFTALVEDVLELYGRPDWPSAELILQTLSVSMITKLRVQEEKPAHFRILMLEALGALAAKMCTVYGKKIIEMGLEIDRKRDLGDSLELHRESLLVYLNPKKSIRNAAAHFFYESMFVADDLSKLLKMKKSLEEQKRVDEDNAMDVDIPTSEDIHEKLLRTGDKRSRQVAKKLSGGAVIEWNTAKESAVHIGASRSFANGFNTILEAILDGVQDDAPTVRARSIRALTSVDNAHHGILRAFPSALRTIEESCRDISTLARDAALDLLSRSITQHKDSKTNERSGNHVSSPEVEVNVTMFDRILGVVEKRLNDAAVSVRKRAITIMRLVLREALDQWKLASQSNEYDSLGVDTTRNQLEKRIVRVCSKLVPRVEDQETTVREASERALRLGLFELDTSDRSNSVSASRAEDVEVFSERLITVFTTLQPAMRANFLGHLLSTDLLKKHSEMISNLVSKTVSLLYDYEEKLVDFVEPPGATLADIRELRKSYAERRAACASLVTSFAELDAKLLLPHYRPMAAIIKGVERKNLSHGDLFCMQRVLRVLELVLKTPSNSGIQTMTESDDFLQSVLQDVETIVCRYAYTALEEPSVRVLCVIAKRSNLRNGPELLQGTAHNFLQFLQKHMSSLRALCRPASFPIQHARALESNGRCALVRVGLLARFADFEQKFNRTVYDTLATACEETCTKTTNGNLAKASIRGLYHVIIRHRYLLMPGTEVLLKCMRNCGDTMNGHMHTSPNVSAKVNGKLSIAESVQLCVIQGFLELLRDEEDRNSSPDFEESAQGRGAGSTRSAEGAEIEESQTKGGSEGRTGQTQNVLAAEEDSEAGFLAASAQIMAKTIEESISSRRVVIRQSAANVLALLVRQGLVLPASVVKSFFCLMLDNDMQCRELAYRVVSFLSKRYSGMLSSATVPAFSSCFEPSFYVRYGFYPRAETRRLNGEAVPMQNDGVASPTSTQNTITSIEDLMGMALNRKTRYALLSPAIMALSRDQRRGVLASIMKRFDPRVKDGPRQSPTPHFSDGAVNDVEMSNGDAAFMSQDSLAVDQVEEVIDEDVGRVSTSDTHVTFGDNVTELPVLYFFAITLASIDYTNGAGVGGSLSQGGGTAAADVKMRNAREDVGGMVSTATRIIANSGQIVMRALEGLDQESLERKKEIALAAARLSLLLSLKTHLKVMRMKRQLDADEEEEVELDAPAANCSMPPFSPDVFGLRLATFDYQVSERYNEDEDINDVVKAFRRLMQEDKIDEKDITGSLRRVRGVNRRKSGTGLGRGRNGTSPATPRRTSSKAGGSTRKPKRRQIRIGQSGDEDDSDYNPF